MLHKHDAKSVAESIEQHGKFECVALHGDLSQAQRTVAIERFRDGGARVLVATDVAARGLDVRNVRCVINIGVGLSIEGFVHRVGRCGRFGDKGLATTIVTEDDKLVGALVDLLRKNRRPFPRDLMDLGDRFNAAAAKKAAKSNLAQWAKPKDDDSGTDDEERSRLNRAKQLAQHSAEIKRHWGEPAIFINY